MAIKKKSKPSKASKKTTAKKTKRPKTGARAAPSKSAKKTVAAKPAKKKPAKTQAKAPPPKAPPPKAPPPKAPPPKTFAEKLRGCDAGTAVWFITAGGVEHATIQRSGGDGRVVIRTDAGVTELVASSNVFETADEARAARY